jgi:tetratricopeptide (TPR) repeat protein
MGKLTEAKLQYHTAAERFPQAADPVFNLAVLAWKDGNWNEVVEDLEEVLRRNPNHLQARAHLEDAKKRLRESRR